MSVDSSPQASVLRHQFPMGHREMERPVVGLGENYYVEDEQDLQDVQFLDVRADLLPQGFSSEELDRLHNHYKEISVSYGLEIDSLRTREVEDRLSPVENMLGEGAERLRVVIMKRGLFPNTFTSPDRTIFISQSIIDSVKSTDELMGLVVHEARHLSNRTYDWKAKVSVNTAGVPWLHEILSDQGTPDILESMGLNSLGLRYAFQSLSDQISGVDRAHMTDLRRRVQQLGRMKISHSATSSTELKSLPERLKHPDGNPEITALPTNWESFDMAMKENDFETVDIIIPNLSTRDFTKLYHNRENCEPYIVKKEAGKKDNVVFTTQEEKSLRAAESIEKVLHERLRNKGYSEEEILMFRISLYNQDRYPCNLYPIPEGLSAVELVSKAREFVEETIGDEIYNEVFGKKGFEIGPGFLEHLVHLTREKDDQSLEESWGIKIDGESVLEICKVVSGWAAEHMAKGSARHKATRLMEFNTELIIRYTNVWLSMDEDRHAVNKYAEFIEEAARRGILVSKSKLIRKLDSSKYDYSYRNRQVFRLGPEILPKSSGEAILAKMLKEFFDHKFGERPKEREDVIPEVTLERINRDFDIFATIPTFNKEGESRPEVYEARQKSIRFVQLMQDTARYLTEKAEADGPTRLEFARYLSAKVDELDFESKEMWYAGPWRRYEGANMLALLREGDAPQREFESNEFPENEDISEIAKQAKFNLNMAIAISAFDKDIPEFYEFVKEVMEKSGIDISTLTPIQIINMCHPLLGFYKNGDLHSMMLYAFDSQSNVLFAAEGRKDPSVSMHYSDITRLESLPFIRELLQRQDQLDIWSFEELKDYTKNIFEKYILKRYDNNHMVTHLGELPIPIINETPNKRTPFDELPIQIIIGKPIIDRVEQLILNGEISESSYDPLYTFVEEVYPYSRRKSEILKGIRLKYVTSSGIPLEGRIKFLLDNIGELGVEGIVTLAEQIDEYPVFTDFEDRLGSRAEGSIGGSKEVTVLALSDFAASFIKQKSEKLMQTAMEDEDTSRRITTDIVIEWAKLFLRPNGGDDFMYDYKNGQFLFSGVGERVFRTPIDVINELQGLDIAERIYIAEKSLADRGGALESRESRERLADDLQRSLNLEGSFFGMLLEEITMQADSKGNTADVYTLVASSLLAPLLFRGFDISKVDYERVLDEVEFTLYGEYEGAGPFQNKKVKLGSLISKEKLREIVNSQTYELTKTGTVYKKSLDSEFFVRAQEATSVYRRSVERLFEQFGDRRQVGKKKPQESKLPLNTEALIRGAELGGGIMGVRSMQQLRMMKRFSPVLAERLARTFDANEGLEKARFFHNLRRHAKRDLELEQYLENRLVRIGEKVGGGSMATAYECIVLDDKGNEVKAVMRMLVPNPGFEIMEISTLFRNGLDMVIKKPRGLGETRRQYTERVNNAKLGRSVVNMCESWCLEDIVGDNYEQLDDEYRETTVRDFNLMKGREAIKVPVRLFTSKMVRIEGKAQGKSLREFVDNRDVPQKLRDEAAVLYREFVGFQYDGNYKVDGSLVHTDPTPGNYFVSFDDNYRPVLHVLDRGMPLRRGESETQILESLENYKYLNFVRGVITNILEYNGADGQSITEYVNKIKIKVGGLRVRGILNRSDQATLLTGILEVVASEGYSIPHRLQLLLRNKVSYETVL